MSVRNKMKDSLLKDTLSSELYVYGYIHMEKINANVLYLRGYLKIKKINK